MLERISVSLLIPCTLWTVAAQADSAADMLTPRPHTDARGRAGANLTSPTSQALPSVELFVVPPMAAARVIPPAVASLGQRLRGWFRSSGVVTTFSYAPELVQRSVLQPTGNAGVRVWVVFSDSISQIHPGSAHLYFAVERSANQELKFLWRSVDLSSGLDELGVEELVQVIQLSSFALWEGSVETSRGLVTENLGREPGVIAHDLPPVGVNATSTSQRLDGARSAALPRGASVPNWRRTTMVRLTQINVTVARDGPVRVLRPTLGIGYAVRWRGPEGAATGPEMMLGVNYWFGRHAAGVRASWQSLSTQEIRLAPVTFEVGGNSLRMVAHATLPLTQLSGLTMELGGGLDIIRYRTTRTADPQLEPEFEPHDLRPFIDLGVGVERRAGPFRVGLSTSLAVQIRDTRYGFANSDEFYPQVIPWRVQPGLRLELSWQ